MFDNIGGKIKTLAVILCVLGIIASFAGAVALWAQSSRYNDTILEGVAILVAGCIGSWVGSFFIYGFGQLIENSDLMVEKLNTIERRCSAVQSAVTAAPAHQTTATAVPVSQATAPAAPVLQTTAENSAPVHEASTGTDALIARRASQGAESVRNESRPASSQQSAQGRWKCSKCGSENWPAQLYCRDCGKYR